MLKIEEKLQKHILSGDWPSDSRSRGIETVQKRFDTPELFNFINERFQQTGKLRILEIGSGVGKLLWDLQIMFPFADIHGLNKVKDRFIKNKEDLIMSAFYYHNISFELLNQLKKPEIYFQNCENLPFDNDYFDVIISLTTLEYVERKDIALQEIWRVLNLEGIAYIELDSIEACHKKCPDNLRSDSPRFIILDSTNSIISAKSFFEKINSEGYCIVPVIKKGKLDLKLIKNTTNKLILNLEFVKDKSINLTEMKIINKENNSCLWGYQSVFNNIG